MGIITIIFLTLIHYLFVKYNYNLHYIHIFVYYNTNSIQNNIEAGKSMGTTKRK